MSGMRVQQYSDRTEKSCQRDRAMLVLFLNIKARRPKRKICRLHNPPCLGIAWAAFNNDFDYSSGQFQRLHKLPDKHQDG